MKVSLTNEDITFLPTREQLLGLRAQVDFLIQLQEYAEAKGLRMVWGEHHRVKAALVAERVNLEVVADPASYPPF